jgi:uncharacterized protein (DUF885 family)
MRPHPSGRSRLDCARLGAGLAVFVASLAACGGATPPGATETPAQSFDAWAEAFIQEWVRAAPQLATRTQYFAGEEQRALDRQLTLSRPRGAPFGVAASDRRAALARRGRDGLSRIPTASMTPMERASAAVLRWALDEAVASAEFANHRYVFDQFGGLQLDLVQFLTEVHPIRDRQDVENYLMRLALVASVVDEGIAEARAAAAAGIVPPRFILERTIAQLDVFLESPARANVFVTTLDRRIEAIGAGIAAANRGAFVAAAEQTVAGAIIPAYRRIRDLLSGQLTASADDAGVWRLPRGGDFYAQALQTYTTTRLTADEIHDIGLKEVERLEGEMDHVLRQLGYARGTVNERYAQLEAARQPKGAEPRPGILADTEQWVRDAERRAAHLFDVRPKAPVEVRREPTLTERTAAAHYTSPAPDGTRPGIYWLPLPGPPYPILRLRSTAYHEAVPGHHFQRALQQEMTDLPRFRSRNVIGAGSAFAEGWALYAERLADEDGWYEGDPHGRLGYLYSMLFRARRLVVDTGIHAKRWTRQQAIDYGINAQEVERYVVWPGQACSYMIGQIRIVELREKARAALGAKFSTRDFHTLVLRTSDVPLDVLADEVDAWITSTR